MIDKHKILDCINFYLTPLESSEIHSPSTDAFRDTPEGRNLEDGEVEIDVKTELVEQEGGKGLCQQDQMFGKSLTKVVINQSF